MGATRRATTEYVIVAFKFDSKDKADFALAASGRKKESPSSVPATHARHGFVRPGGIIGCVSFLPLPAAVAVGGGKQDQRYDDLSVDLTRVPSSSFVLEE